MQLTKSEWPDHEPRAHTDIKTLTNEEFSTDWIESNKIKYRLCRKQNKTADKMITLKATQSALQMLLRMQSSIA